MSRDESSSSSEIITTFFLLTKIWYFSFFVLDFHKTTTWSSISCTLLSALCRLSISFYIRLLWLYIFVLSYTTIPTKANIWRFNFVIITAIVKIWRSFSSYSIYRGRMVRKWRKGTQWNGHYSVVLCNKMWHFRKNFSAKLHGIQSIINYYFICNSVVILRKTQQKTFEGWTEMKVYIRNWHAILNMIGALFDVYITSLSQIQI